MNIRSGKLASVSTWWCTWAGSYFEGAAKFLHFSRIPTRRGQDGDDHGGDHQDNDDDYEDKTTKVGIFHGGLKAI